ncbi:transcriptional regulator, TetR family [Actinopolyspora lacussalsi subsp. righensis]|uniref:Transcriptional regulator, TetR family n=1 Tax=Actinopolyspora righensis TaxID=995060 RepID=A0A1I6X230_9ACTN|nr:ScbR family autoregulator-binding transcription factor [Actinopolyspora righensis]SFT32269.1 transcriptional regulator, TetR family [Actinopolyspora righensis]
MAQLKQDRALYTRAKIIRAAAEVFDDLGFASASLSKIVNRAGVTIGAVYFHFTSKEELARAVMAEQVTDMTFPAGEEGLQLVIDITLDVARQLQHNTLLRAGIRLAVEQGAFGLEDDAAYSLWTELLRRQLAVARERGELLDRVDEREFAQLLVGAYTGTQLVSQITAGHDDLTERIATLWYYFLPGVAVPEVIPRLRLEPATSDTESF